MKRSSINDLNLRVLLENNLTDLMEKRECLYDAIVHNNRAFVKNCDMLHECYVNVSVEKSMYSSWFSDKISLRENTIR